MVKGKDETVDVVVSFDTTGSMYACLGRVRRRVGEMIGQLFREIPNLRMGIIAHGDYCDEGSSYVIRAMNLVDNQHELQSFVMEVPPTNGGDSPECYELVLHKARSFRWGPGKKVLIVIGDDVPHPPTYPMNRDKLNWRTEIDLLTKMGVQVYGVQALNRGHATAFYREIAERTGGFHLTLDQFTNVVEMVMAICMQQGGSELLQRYENQVADSGKMNRSLDETFGVLSGRKTPSKRYSAPRDLEAVPPGRFQVMRVDDDQQIRDFVQANGLIFKKGSGFYELMKKETIQDNKEVVLLHEATGDLYGGDKARELLGLPRVGKVRVKPVVPEGYTAFIQSNSVNRKLIGGYRFLYEVDMSR